jgi:hypothetical protein
MRSNMVTGDLHDLLVHVDDAVSTLVDVVTQDRRVGLGAWPHDELSAAASAVTALAARLGFVRAALTREVDVRGSFREDACVSAVGWLRMARPIDAGRGGRGGATGPWARLGACLGGCRGER